MNYGKSCCLELIEISFFVLLFTIAASFDSQLFLGQLLQTVQKLFRKTVANYAVPIHKRFFLEYCVNNEVMKFSIDLNTTKSN